LDAHGLVSAEEEEIQVSIRRRTGTGKFSIMLQKFLIAGEPCEAIGRRPRWRVSAST